ncbi:MAG: transcription termination/antitermination protein NusG [Rickettsiales bacterium]|nr:transcription termination/antitermination protein NusG [Rickettsiales bacterium]
MASKWYIVHAYSGFEKKVAQSIKEQAAQQGISNFFDEVVVPTENVVEMRRGKKVASERRFFPGYVLVKMDLNDQAWHLVKNIPKVAGFLGGGGRPQPISDMEAERIFKQVEEGIQEASRGVVFEVGEQVKVVDGPFDSFIGVIEEVDEDKERIKVSVTIFGRPTPVDLQYSQVEKVA